MITMDDISNSIMNLIRLGSVARLTYCMVRLLGAEEDSTKYKKRAKNVVVFYIIAENIWQMKELLFFYFK